jgi:hypothetical protein
MSEEEYREAAIRACNMLLCHYSGGQRLTAFERFEARKALRIAAELLGDDVEFEDERHPPPVNDPNARVFRGEGPFSRI